MAGGSLEVEYRDRRRRGGAVHQAVEGDPPGHHLLPGQLPLRRHRHSLPPATDDAAAAERPRREATAAVDGLRRLG